METGIDIDISEHRQAHHHAAPAAVCGDALPMQRREWQFNAALHLAGGRSAVLFDCGGENALPMLHTDGRTPRLVIPGAAQTGEPCDLPWSDTAELRALAQRLASQPLAVELPRLPADSPTLDALKQALRGRGWLHVSPAQGTPYIDLHDGWKDPQSQFNAGRRSDFRRAERHAEKAGGLSFELHRRADAATLDRLLDEAFDVEARSWKGERGSALAIDPQLGRFFRQYAHTAMRAGVLRLAFMRVGGQAVGMQIAVESGQRYWLLKIGYDPAYSRCSPGNLLMLHTLGEAARRGLRSYEFLGNPAPWTAQWTTTERPHLRVRLYPASLAGTRAWLDDAFGYLAQRRRASTPRPEPTATPAVTPVMPVTMTPSMAAA